MESVSKKIVYICLAIAIVGTVSIYYLSTKIETPMIEISEITFDYVGTPAKVKGFIVSRYDHENGHIFLTITDGEDRSLDVPLFSSFVDTYDAHNRQKAQIEELRKGTLVEIEGLVGEYKGQLQLVPKEPNDLKILYDR